MASRTSASILARSAFPAIRVPRAVSAIANALYRSPAVAFPSSTGVTFPCNAGVPRCGRRLYSFSTLSPTGIPGQINQSQFTEMAWEVLVDAIEYAKVNRQLIVESEHLLKSLLEQKDGLASKILTKTGLDNSSVLETVDKFIPKQPKVTRHSRGPVLASLLLVRESSPVVGPYLASLVERADEYKKEMGDEFISLKHLLLACHSDQRLGQQLFSDHNLSEMNLREAIFAVYATLSDLNPKGKYEEKYGDDSTKLARSSRHIIRGDVGQPWMNRKIFTEIAWDAVARAIESARVNKQQIVESENLMKALLDGPAQRILTEAGFDCWLALQVCDDFISKQPKLAPGTFGPMLGFHLASVLERGANYTIEFGDDYIGVEHLLLAFHLDLRFGQNLYDKLHLDDKDLRDFILNARR